jgi:type I restriction enzyme S subunit
MTELTNLVPKRRFKKFSNTLAWEQRKLGAIAEFNPKSELPEVFEYVDLESVVGTEMIAHREETKATAPSRAQRLARQGDLFYQTVRPYQKNNYLFKKPYDNYVFSTGYAQIRPYGNSYFLLSLVQNDLFVKAVLDRCTGTSYPAINSDDLANMGVHIPTNDKEQTQIGDFFEKLDHIITLHQRKLEKTKALKSAYLSEMFPTEGEREPKRRFAGFTNAWEQCKLGEYAKFRRGSFPQPYGNKDWYDGTGAMPFVQVVDVGENLRLVDYTKQKISKLAQPKSVFVPARTVIVTLQGSIGRVAITQYDSYVDRTLLIFDDYQFKTNEYFWAYTIQRKFDIEKQIAPGGTIKTITKEALSAFEVSLPNYEEQEEIGKFFKHLDETIALHQRKLEKLQNLKKAYLNEMFV